MEKAEILGIPSSKKADEPTNDSHHLLQSLPKERDWDGYSLYFYKGFWCPERAIQGMINYQNHFQPRDTDILLASVPKSGTTWLKALIFSIVHRTKSTPENSSLFTASLRVLVPSLEFSLYRESQCPNLDGIPSPRIFSTHTPFPALPSSVINSKCRIVYICRNPLDQFISHRYFLLQNLPESYKDNVLSVNESFEMYQKGVHRFGSFWEHVLGYWHSSLNDTHTVLFLKYEDVKMNTAFQVKKIADFLGFPFSKEEEKQGLVEEIVKLCSFENLKELEVNKEGGMPNGPRSSSFFRKGEIGDWSNHLSASMAENYKKLLEDKLDGSGLSFKFHAN